MAFNDNFFETYRNNTATDTLTIQEGDYDSFTIDDIEVLATQLLQLPHIKVLEINNNEELNDDYIIKLASYLPNLNLEKLRLNQNLISDRGIDALAKALTNHKTLTTLELSECNVTAVGARYLADMLKKNSIMKSIDLTAREYTDDYLNQIGNEGAHVLYNALLVNESLSELKISEENNITNKEILTKINTCLEKNKVKALSNSNLPSNSLQQWSIFQNQTVSVSPDNESKCDIDEQPKHRQHQL